MSAIGSGGTVTMTTKIMGVTEMITQLKQLSTVMGEVSAQVTKMSGTMSQTMSSALPQSLQQVGTSADQATVKTQTFTERMAGFQGNLLTAATSTGTFTASIWGIDAAMDNLTRTELSLEQARVRQDRMQTTLQAQELRLNELRQSGTATLDEIAVAEDRVNTTRQQLEVQTERVDFMQQNLNEDYAQFGQQILPQVITAALSGVTAFQSWFTLIGKNQKAVEFLNSAWAKLSSTFSSAKIVQGLDSVSNAMANTTTAANVGLIPAMGGVWGIIGTGAAIIAGATAPMVAYQSNFLGLREKAQALGLAIGNTFPFMKGLLNYLESVQQTAVNTTFGFGKVNISVKEMSNVFAKSGADIGNALVEVNSKLVDFETQAANTGKTMTAQEQFNMIFGGQPAAQQAVNAFKIIIEAIEGFDTMLNNSSQTMSQADFQGFTTNLYSMLGKARDQIRQAGGEIPKELTTMMEKVKAAYDKSFTFDLKFGDITGEFARLQKDFNSLLQDFLGNSKATAQELSTIVAHMLDPVGSRVAEVIAKLKELKVPPEFGLGMGEVSKITYDLAEAFNTNLFSLNATNKEMDAIATGILPRLVDGYAKLNPEINTENEYLQLLVNTYGEGGKNVDAFTQSLLNEAKARGIKKQVTGETIVQLTEEQQKIAELIKSYFSLETTDANVIRSYEARVKAVDDAIKGYTDEIQALKETQIEYGATEQAVYGINDATQERIDALKEEILQEQERTNALIDVTKIMDESTESQIKMNEAMIEGTKAAADFVTELVTAEKQTEAYGKALSENVMEVLEKYPQLVGDFADAFKETLPNLFASLEEFQGKIKPFDKQSIKDYKEELKDLDVPKSLRDLYVDSAKVWQDKDEIIKEGEALFAGMAGALTHNFEEIDVEDVTGFLDEIEGKLTELEAEGVGTGFTDNIRGLIDEIRNSEDPVQALMTNFDTLKAAMDPEAFDAITVSMRAFGGEGGALAQAVGNADSLTQALNLLADSDLINRLGELDKVIQSTGERLQGGIKGKGEGGLQDVFRNISAEAEQAQLVSEGYKGTGGGGAGAEEDQANAQAMAWEDAQLRIQTAMTAITTAIQTAMTTIQTAIATSQAAINTSLLLMIQGVTNTQTSWSTFSTSLQAYGTSMSANWGIAQQAINESLLLMIEGVFNTQTTWSTFSTSLATYSTSMSDNVGISQQAINESLLLEIEGVTNTHETWSVFSTSLATYTKSMTTNTENWSKASITSFNNADTALTAFHESASTLSTSIATYCKSMTANLAAWEKAVVSNMDNAAEAFGKAKDAVDELQSAIDALKSKTVTIKVNIEKSGGGATQQYGGAEILTGPKYVFAGEGHKPEIHFFYPLDKMAQSHAKSEYKLPFNLGDLAGPKISAGTIVPTAGAGGAPQMVLPTNMVSNINMRANLNIDLGNEIKKVVRQEIRAISEARLDRMPMR